MSGATPTASLFRLGPALLFFLLLLVATPMSVIRPGDVLPAIGRWVSYATCWCWPSFNPWLASPSGLCGPSPTCWCCHHQADGDLSNTVCGWYYPGSFYNQLAFLFLLLQLLQDGNFLFLECFQPLIFFLFLFFLSSLSLLPLPCLLILSLCSFALKNIICCALDPDYINNQPWHSVFKLVRDLE